MAGIPTLGYPSRTDAVQALRAQGNATGEIAAKIGVTPQYVLAIEHSAKNRSPDRQAWTGRTIALSEKAIETLAPHAAARGTTAGELARRILDAVAAGGLVDAVLDDAGGPA